MTERLQFYINRLGERLWVRPLFMCILAIAFTFIARSADYTSLGEFVPDITAESIKTLLSVIAASMLSIATFSVASMVSAYASASGTATPRSFSLVIADDVSQNALSAFIGSFIFSIISLIALENSYYDKAGRFTLFAITLVVFAIVIVTFVRWVDSIARLGRLGTTIDKVEGATATALKRRRLTPTLGGMGLDPHQKRGEPVYSKTVGYVQRVDVSQLQHFAEEADAHIEVAALPGTFAAPGRILAYVRAESDLSSNLETDEIVSGFLIGDSRTFDEDPRFGLIALSEIASRALSPGINDPGTAIDVIGTLVRLFNDWGQPLTDEEKKEPTMDRVAVPELSLDDLFTDAFSAIARDGAGTVEVVIHLQKAFEALAFVSDGQMERVARQHARQALARAEMALEFPDDLESARQAALTT